MKNIKVFKFEPTKSQKYGTVFSYEMTTSVIFCLSYDLSKEFFIAFKVDNISTKTALLSRTSS